MFSLRKCESQSRLDGKTVVITGATSGIGKETAKNLYKRGARIVLSSITLEEGLETIEDIKQQCLNVKNLGELKAVRMDLGNLKSVCRCAEKILTEENEIHVLINNAAVLSSWKLTDDGFEVHFGVNYLGHFYLTLLLLPKLVKSRPSRIVNVSSISAKYVSMNLDDLNWKKRDYGSFQAYGESKLALILFTKELARRLKAAKIEDVTVHTLHPGVAYTSISKNFNDIFFGLRSAYVVFCRFIFPHPEDCCQTTLHCVLSENCAKESGKYYTNCAEEVFREDVVTVRASRRLWKETLGMLGIDRMYDPFI